MNQPPFYSIPVFIDTETCGLHSIAVLLQYAIGDGSVELVHLWDRPVVDTLRLIEELYRHPIVGFNLAFDHFHLQKLHAIWSRLPGDLIPRHNVSLVVRAEREATDCLCLRPTAACDLMLVALQGEGQNLMRRKDVRIRRVPLAPVPYQGAKIPMAHALADHLTRTVQLDPIFFARLSNGYQWTVVDGEYHDPNLADVKLSFSPSNSLKAWASHILGFDVPGAFEDAGCGTYPIELGYAPYATAVPNCDLYNTWAVTDPTKPGKIDGYAWPGLIQEHITHWATNATAIKYATDDIVYTRALYKHFNEPTPGDVNSELAICVASVRWRGFKVDLDKIKALKAKAALTVAKSPININSPTLVKDYLLELCDDTEAVIFAKSARQEILKENQSWLIETPEPCSKCSGLGGDCLRCAGTGELQVGPHPVTVRCKELLAIKSASKEIELFDKIETAGRFHASFRVIGAKSSRMAGTDDLNAQGIKNDPLVRDAFTLKDDGYDLNGGDFSAFEVVIADAVYDDEDLRNAILAGTKIHGLFGTALFPEFTYDQILDSAKNPHNYEYGDMYTLAKSGVFACIYGGNAQTLHKNLGVSIDVAEAAMDRWFQMFPGIKAKQDRITDNHMALRQEGGLGSRVDWVEPKEYVESLTGFRRYFTLENQIAKALFQLANSLPDELKSGEPVVRSEYRGVQRASGALSSALYGAAFQICQAVVRAAANHEIQSTGADITKELQKAIWALQPIGVHEFVVAPMNIHDECQVVTRPDYTAKLQPVVDSVLEKYKPIVPLIAIDWRNGLASWAGKSGK